MTAAKKASHGLATSKPAKLAIKSNQIATGPVDPAQSEIISYRDRYFQVLQRSLKAAQGGGDAAHNAASGFVFRYGQLYALAAEAVFSQNHHGVLAKLRRKEEAAADALSPGRLIGEPADEVEEVVARAIARHERAKVRAKVAA